MSDTEDYTIYDVESTKHSASAFIIFAHHSRSNQPIVIKVLRDFQDERYDFSTPDKRQDCQIEALTWNRIFTANVYHGLARIRESLEQLEQKEVRLEHIGIGQVLEKPKKTGLVKEIEYALLMDLLPEDRRLDVLLQTTYYTEGETVPQYLLLLTKRINYIHTQFQTVILETEISRWGSIEQLREKLRENLIALKNVLDKKPDITDIYHQLENILPALLEMKTYQELFNRRLEEKQIKRCHGDLKATNIWIAPDSPQCDEQPNKGVWLLDTIDFNSSYCMIDTLSDLALLAVDVQARTDNPDLSNAIIDSYLHLSGEDEESARHLLSYYLVEKGIVGTVNSYIDDNDEELGDGYLKVVYQRLGELMNRIN
jgi:aminoglycoside phosphotransferase family enzyme